MITTISTETICTLMDIELDKFTNTVDANDMCIVGGRIQGMFVIISKLDGFPVEKAEEYAHRLGGICELKNMFP